MYKKEILSKRIKELRQEKNLTQRQLAEKANTTATSISAYEKGQKTPSIEVLCNIANALETSVDWLCGNLTSEGAYTFLGVIITLVQRGGQLEDIINFMVQYAKMSELLSADKISQDMFDSWLTGTALSDTKQRDMM